LIAIFRECEAADKECSRVDGEAPTGESRRLGKTELIARGLKQFSASSPSILKQTTLPDFADSQRQLWPPSQQSIATMVTSSPAYQDRYSPDWWQQGKNFRQQEEARQHQAAEEAEKGRRQFFQPR
jgi:hypothetical protein